MSVSKEIIGLKSINEQTRKKVVTVRIIRLWVQKDKLGKEGLEMIMVDEWGDKIQASISVGYKRRFTPLLSEGHIYRIENFQILENSPSFQTAKIDHLWRIGFGLATKVSEPEKFVKISEYGFNFVSFKDVLSHNATFFLDILGEVKTRTIEMKSVEMRGAKVATADVEIADVDGTKVTCVLWESFAHQLKSYMEKLSADVKEPVMIALQFAKISNYKGTKVSTMKNATKLFIQSDIQEVKDFIKRRGAHNGIQISDSITNISSYGSDLNMMDWLNTTLAKTIDELKDSNEGDTYICNGIIKDFHPTESWFYDSCDNDKCHKGVLRGSKVGDFCKKCNRQIGSIVPRYMLKVLVEDYSGCLYFTIFEDCAVQFLNKTAAQVMEEIEKESVDINGTPEILETMLEMECLFRVEIGRFVDRVYTVKKITEDSSIISQFSSLRIHEVESKLNNCNNLTKKGANEEEYIEETCSTSTNSQMTPLKRRYDDLTDDDIDGGNIQLSVTKISKK